MSKWPTTNHSREREIWFKQKTRPRMTCEGIDKTISKKSQIQKTEKNIKNQSENAACEQ